MSEDAKNATEPNNARITDALMRLDEAIYGIKLLGQKINGTQVPSVETAVASDPLSLAELINNLPGRLDKAVETIKRHIEEIRDMIL